MKTSFCFWNINKKPLSSSIASVVETHEVDVLMLVETTYDPADILLVLNRNGPAFHFTFSVLDDLVIFTRFPRQFTQTLFEQARWTIRAITLPGRDEILLVVVHFPSKLHWSNDSQQFLCTELARVIRDVEKSRDHNRTVVVGDLNMNPFEPGIMAAPGFQAVMTRQTASLLSRVVNEETYPFFYNPMWGKFGDGDGTPPGTFYDYRSEYVSFFWNMFDQILIRPALLEHFNNKDLHILSSDGGASLLNDRGLPDTRITSDHLPIVFKLEL